MGEQAEKSRPEYLWLRLNQGDAERIEVIRGVRLVGGGDDRQSAGHRLLHDQGEDLPDRGEGEDIAGLIEIPQIVVVDRAEECHPGRDLAWNPAGPGDHHLVLWPAGLEQLLEPLLGHPAADEEHDRYLWRA